MSFKLISILLSVTLFVGCLGGNSRSGSEDTKQPTVFETYYPDFKLDVLGEKLRGEFTDSSYTADVFRANNYAPLWSGDMEDSCRLERLLSHIELAADHGLNPESFSASTIRSTYDSVRAGHYSDNINGLYGALVSLERLATDATIKFSTGMSFGFVDPNKIFTSSFSIPYQKVDNAYYKGMVAGMAVDPIVVLEKSIPTDSTYIEILKSLARYNQIADSAQIKIPNRSEGYKLGEKNVAFPLIAKRLMLTGELQSSDFADSLYSTLNEPLIEAINDFCVHNSYPANKEYVSRYVVEALNRPMSYYRNTLTTNLERRRWRRKNGYGERNIEVNIASFTLQAFSANQYLRMKVCTGGHPEHHTPLLESKITYMNLNPTWSVPRSIASAETYWMQHKDSTYMKRNGMKLRDRSGQEVDLSTIKWNELNPETMPYTFRQDPGAGNALGRVKFMFNNQYSVYLHDTPTQSPFGYRNRAVSHGCVRLEQPLNLARFCLSERDSVYFDRLLVAIDKAPQSAQGKALMRKGGLRKLDDIVNLSTAVNLWIDYHTTYLLPNDPKLYFADDVYEFDPNILSTLRGEFKPYHTKDN